MSRYIDAEWLIKESMPLSFSVQKWVNEVQIMTAPSIDIVNCEECRECVEKGTGADCPSGYGYLYCNRLKSVVDEDFYCGWGERR